MLPIRPQFLTPRFARRCRLSQPQVKAIGLSNYHASEVARAFDLCKEHSLTPPTVYQGLYNPLNRMVEEEVRCPTDGTERDAASHDIAAAG